jgi:undecaprenyl pyrophosphate phosphatase UppP
LEDLTVGEFFEIIKKIKISELLELLDDIPFEEFGIYLIILGFVCCFFFIIKIIYHLWLIFSIGKIKHDINFVKAYLHSGDNTDNRLPPPKHIGTGWKIIITGIVGYFVLCQIINPYMFYSLLSLMIFIVCIFAVIISALLVLIIKRLKHDNEKNTFQTIIDELKKMVKNKTSSP